MAEKTPSPNKSEPHHISDSGTSDEESNPCLHTSIEERHYGTIPGSAQAKQAALSHTRAQTNPTVEKGLPRQPRIRQLPQHKADEKSTQTKTDKSAKKVYILSTQTLIDSNRYLTINYNECLIVEKGSGFYHTAVGDHAKCTFSCHCRFTAATFITTQSVINR